MTSNETELLNEIKKKDEEIKELKDALQQKNRIVFTIVRKNSELESQARFDTRLKEEAAKQLKLLLQENEEVLTENKELREMMYKYSNDDEYNCLENIEDMSNLDGNEDSNEEDLSSSLSDIEEDKISNKGDGQKILVRNRKLSKYSEIEVERKLTKLVNKYFKAKEMTSYDKIWLAQFKRLLRYKEEHGDCNVIASYGDKSLVSWVACQRKAYFKKKRSMIEYRTSMLQDVGFTWSGFIHISQRAWDTRFDALVRFKKEHGHVDVPYECVYEGSKLGYWVCTQRSLYNFKLRGEKTEAVKRFTDVRIKKLESLGFRWEIRKGPRRKST